MLAWIQPARFVTRARAGPARDFIPVSASTSRSASAVRSSKSGCSAAYRYDSSSGSEPATRTATRSARSHATGSVTGLLLRVLEAHNLDEVSDPDPNHKQEHRDDDEVGDPIGPDLRGK